MNRNLFDGLPLNLRHAGFVGENTNKGENFKMAIEFKWLRYITKKGVTNDR